MRVVYVGIALMLGSLCAQAAGDSSGRGVAPDHSGLTGVWTRRGFRDYPEVDAFLGFRMGGLDQTRVIIVSSVPPLKTPYLQQWRAREIARHEADLRGEPFSDMHSRCMPDGMPSMMRGMFPMEVLAAPGEIAIIEEAYRQIRHIYLDQKQVSIADAEPAFWGHSVGHWEGDTLIVNTVGVKESVTLEDVPHSNQMQIDERIRLLTPNSYEDSFTVRDPVYLTHPWSFVWQYERDPTYKLLEYVCEDNREENSGIHQHLQLFDK